MEKRKKLRFFYCKLCSVHWYVLRPNLWKPLILWLYCKKPRKVNYLHLEKEKSLEGGVCSDNNHDTKYLLIVF